MSKPTMQDIADNLGISRISVWKALSGRNNISQALKEKILLTAEEMGYNSSQKKENSATYNTIALAISSMQLSSFWSEIIHEIARQLSLSDVNLLYAYVPLQYKDGDKLPSALTNSEVSGVIALNVYCKETLIELSKLSMPKVFFDKTPDIMAQDLNGDVVMLEGENSSYNITSKLIADGARKLAFIGDIGYSQINSDIYDGFCNSLESNNIPLDEKLCLTTSFFPNKHHDEIYSFLGNLKEMPQAIVCASNYMASFVVRYFHENPNFSKPKITGFYNDNYSENIFERITTAEVNPKAIGKRLAYKILFLRDYPNLPQEISYIATTPLNETEK